LKLKSITIHGFKSFADRVTISYDNGITGIIGPNGSGKSNVIDAVRWVMGEQTAKSLRADDPTDIIFAGSQSRKPMGMAEVTLTFANDGRMCPPEYLHLPECSITRRIFRDGEREYLLNREQCRLKDISQFLMSIGLGSRTYSIIQQERRDRIVQASPADLRAILEETAGITVFKMQRKEAEKRLHTAGEQLEKLAAVESELTKQSDHLAEQVEKTKRKLALSSELRDDEIALLADNVAFHKSIALTVKEELGKRVATTQKSTVDTAGFEAEATRLTAEKMELTGTLEDKRKIVDGQRMSHTKLSERRENQITLAAERASQLANFDASAASEQRELEESSTRIQAAARQMEVSEEQSKLLDGELEELALQEEESIERARTGQSRMEGVRSEIKVASNRLEGNRTQLESIVALKAILTTRLTEKQAAIAAKDSERTSLIADLAARETSLSEGAGQLTKSEAALSELAQVKSQKTEERKRLGERHEVKHRQLVEMDARLRSLRELVDEEDGDANQSDPKKRPLAKYPKLFASVGLEPEYEDRLEASIPERVALHVVPSLEDVAELAVLQAAIDGSRIHVLAVPALRPLTAAEKGTADALTKLPGMVAATKQLARGKNSKESQLFERIFFCDDLKSLFDQLQLQSEKLGAIESFIFILKSGAVYFGNGELRLGKSQDVRAAGLLKRKREIESLSNGRDTLFAEVHALESEMQRLDLAIEDATAKFTTLTDGLSAHKEAAIRLEAEVAQLRMRIDHIAEFVATANSECDAIQSDAQDQLTRLRSLEAAIASDTKRVETLAGQLEDFVAAAEEDNDVTSEIKRQINAKRDLKQIASSALAAAKVAFEELSLQQDRTRTKLARVQADRAALVEQLELSGKSSGDLEADLDSLALAVRQGEAELEDLSSRIAVFTEQIHVLESKISNEKDSQLKTERMISEKQAELARAEAILETQYRDAWERFGLSETDFTQTEAGPTDAREKLEGKIRNLKKQLEGLGPINEAALAEFDETSQKLSFLRSQKDDITQSIAVLQSSIGEVEERTKASFLETYQQVGSRFESLFPILFPGGDARLNLLDPDNLLETGVEILVRLPGKRMQNMSLFSGGEKALTAISLIFALLQNSPAPFCYLDEVDAPLDEANVGRFNSVLDALSAEFQFVVITHNRRTMEVLDSIYGISMNEPGVSRLVSVDLSEVPNRLKKTKQPATGALRAGAEAQPQNVPVVKEAPAEHAEESTESLPDQSDAQIAEGDGVI
jgi:chromosome segregation protein